MLLSVAAAASISASVAATAAAIGSRSVTVSSGPTASAETDAADACDVLSGSAADDRSSRVRKTTVAMKPASDCVSMSST